MSGDRIEGKRLRLRPARREDIPVLYEWYRDPKLMSLYDGIAFSAESLDTFRDQYGFWLDNDVDFGLAGSFIMELLETGRAIGECSWMMVDRTGPDSPGIYQIGGLIGPPELRGKGLGTEALRLLRDFLFAEQDAHRLEALTVAFNTGAMKTLHHNGFVREGVLREAVMVDGQWRDRVIFSLLRREWESGAAPQTDFPAD
ncbi:MAG TPA: GNAT family protein [bacterium]|jgi:RimJ/RimL family protein N-acetyltransferase